MDSRYLVKLTDDDTTWYDIKTDAEIFAIMDMSDCTGISVTVWKLEEEPVPCVFNGVWHDASDPLKMVIRNAKTDEIYSVGYGTDH